MTRTWKIDQNYHGLVSCLCIVSTLEMYVTTTTKDSACQYHFVFVNGAWRRVFSFDDGEAMDLLLINVKCNNHGGTLNSSVHTKMFYFTF